MENLNLIERVQSKSVVRFHYGGKVIVELDYKRKFKGLPASYEEIVYDLIEFSHEFENALREIVKSKETIIFNGGHTFNAIQIEKFLKR
jgi:hypothetical protein